MRRLLIAEKPSVAQSIAAAITPNVLHRSGYLECGDWLISWCYGHLAELADAKVYNTGYAKWNLKDLPIIPDTFRFQICEEKRKHFDILKDLLRREDVTEVVNACDAGREGELIFRTLYSLAGCTKPMKRLWISSMEAQAIREGLDALRPGADYDGLHQAALCRAKADWLVGVNATRFFSLTFDRTLNIGRVMSTTLALLVQREAEIAAFVPQPYYHVVLDCGFPITSAKLDTKEEAQTLAAACKGNAVTAVSVERTESSEKPPALYDLTTLQREANRLLGYTAQQTLDYAQSLYEKRLLTYPRTDSRYLTADMAETVSCVLHLAAKLPPFDACHDFFPDVTVLISDKDVTDHHAILPTMELEKADIATLPVGERNLLLLVCSKLLSAAAEPQCYETVTAAFDCAGHSFTAKGKRETNTGWREIDRLFRAALKDAPKKAAGDAALPEIREGQAFTPAKVKLTEQATTPPRPYTEDTLLSAMENAGKGDMPQDAERRGIGTPATRSGILEKLVASQFIERKKSKKVSYLRPTQMGVALITVLPEELQSPLLTAEWEHRLKDVESGKLDAADFLADVSEMLHALVQSYTVPPGTDVLFPPEHEVVGICPRCGGKVQERTKGFFCENPACRFAMWKNSRFFEAKKKVFTKKIAAELLKTGKASLKGCYSEKTGKTYDATVVMEDNGERVDYKLVFSRG